MPSLGLHANVQSLVRLDIRTAQRSFSNINLSHLEFVFGSPKRQLGRSFSLAWPDACFKYGHCQSDSECPSNQPSRLNWSSASFARVWRATGV